MIVRARLFVCVAVLMLVAVPTAFAQQRGAIAGKVIDPGGSFTIDLSLRYQLPLQAGLEGVDLFYDIFNVSNRNMIAPTGNRAATFMVPTAAGLPRQMQFGVRVRF